MQTTHRVHYQDARSMPQIPDASVDLVATSPPYPMIEMWDECFAALNPEVRTALDVKDGAAAFQLMHEELDAVWREVTRVVKPGGIVCVNVGVATRSVGGKFCAYPNHSRIIEFFSKNGFDTLPEIIWRKQTNAPNKFMGSGMLPVGAYVTLEHEFILIFRKGPKREFSRPAEKKTRSESAFFWEERNQWFSDLWEFKGTRQAKSCDGVRERNGAFPLELPYRLINMFSIKGDLVLDPFLGTGTTMCAAIIAGRNSAGVERERAFAAHIMAGVKEVKVFGNVIIEARLAKHAAFVTQREEDGDLKYANENHAVSTVTRQERELRLDFISEIDVRSPEIVIAHYDSTLAAGTTHNQKNPQKRTRQSPSLDEWMPLAS